MYAKFLKTRVMQKIVRLSLVVSMTFSLIGGTTFSPALAAEPTQTAAWDYINFAEALQKSLYFYDAEKCGPGVAGGPLEWRGDCHVGDAKMPLKDTSLKSTFIEKYKKILDPDGDGTMDLHGGWHDAGDHVRFGLPQGYAASTIGWSFYEFREAFKKSGQEEHMKEILRHITDTFLRCSFLDENGEMIAFCYMVGEGDMDHTYWGPPELYPKSIPRPADFATAETPASDMCGDTAAALAISYLNFKDEDPAYAAKCLKVAKAMYDFARKYRGLGMGDGYYGSGGDEDEMAWAAVWMYVCTGNMEYIRHIDSVENGNYTGYMKRIIKTTANTWQNIWVHCWDVVWGGVFTKLSTLFPENEQFDYFASWNIEYWSGGKIPHKDPKDTTYLALTPAGYGMINTWGSARYNCGAQLCALVYQKYHPQRTDFAEWARGQMEYIMGKNPMGRSYIVGYGYEKGLPFAKHPHHRAAHGSKTLSMEDPPEHRHILWGALVGGPDAKDVHVDVTTDYVYNEVAVDYNAAFVGASAGLYLLYRQDHQTIPNFPPKEASFDPYYTEATVDQENGERTQVTLKLHNESSQPPHFETSMKVRYYFNISEMLENGQSVEDLTLFVAYDEQKASYDSPVKATGPVQWDNAGTYYYEFDWSGNDIYGDRDYQFALIASQDANWKSHWEPNNDWSRKDLSRTEFTVAKNIPVYLNGVKVFGEEPPKREPTPTPTVDPRVTPITDASVKVLYKCGEPKTEANTIRMSLDLQNTGKTGIKLSDVKLRYWFTGDGDGQNVSCDWAPIGVAKVAGTYVKTNISSPKADGFAEITFASDAGTLAAGASTGAMIFRIFKTDLTPYSQSNDYSFEPVMDAALGENNKITAYVKDALKYGVEPFMVTPTPPPGFKLTGYVLPDLTFDDSRAELVKTGFKVELLENGKSAVTDKNGYFEITGVPANTYSIKISKPNYLYRALKNVVVSKDMQIGSVSAPVSIWAGDTAKDGIQDDAINMGDVMELARVFNSTESDLRYEPKYDFNCDGAINMADVMIVAKHFNAVPGSYPESY